MILKRLIAFAVVVCLFGIFLMGSAEAVATSFSSSSSTSFGSGSSMSSFVTYGSPGGFSQFYTKGDLETYWPILGNKEECQSRKDLLLQVVPGGCQPAVVRSDLLEEQNVPVFCQLQSLKLNPVIDVKEIKNIRFSAAEKYPAGVMGTGFHPANAALRTTNALTGSPLSSNVGYVVVILKKTPNESAMPEDVKVKLTAQVEFDAANALGIGRAEFSLTPTTDAQWELDKIRNSFWNGKYSIRLEEAGADYAVVSIYQGIQKVTTQRVALGKASEEIYLPGLYCRAGLQVNYDGFVAVQKKARIVVSDDNGLDSYDVYEGSKFMDDKCSVNTINVNPLDGTGSLLAYCGTETLNLKINPKLLTTGDIVPAQDIDWSDNPDYLVPAQLKIKGLGEKIDNVARDLIYGKLSVCEVHLKYPFISKEKEGYYSIQRANTSINQGDWKLYKRAAIGAMNGDSQEENMKKEENLWLGVLKQELITKCEQRMVKQDSGSAVKVGDSNNQLAKEKIYPEPAEGNIKNAIESFKQLAQDYPQEGNGVERYGSLGLREAIELAGKLNKERTKVELIDLYNYYYPESPLGESYAIDKAKLSNVDLSGASKTITVNNRAVTVKLVSAENPKEEQASAEFSWGGRSFKLGVGMLEEVPMRTGGNAKITVEALTDVDKVRVRVDCPAEFKNGVVVSTPSSNVPEMVKAAAAGRDWQQSWRSGDFAASWGVKILTLKQSESQCGESLVLENVNLAKVAKIRLVPQAKQLREELNLTVSIGIEKRAIQLTPDETANRIEKLNATLNKLDSLNENLKTVVSGLKAACFATSAMLTAKTFLTGLSGEGLARQQVMKREGGWNQKCADEIAISKKSMSQCFSEHADEINKDVAAFASGISASNNKLKDIEDKSMIKSGLMGGEVVNRSAASEKLIKELKEKYPNKEIILKSGAKTNVNALLDERSYARNDVSYEELRDMYTTLSTTGTSTTGQAALDSNLKTIAGEIDTRREWSVVRENLASSSFSSDLGLKDKPIPSYGNSKAQKGEYYGGSTTTDILATKLREAKLSDAEVSKLSANGRVATQEIMYNNQPYLVVLGATSPSGQSYNAKKIYSIDKNNPKIIADVTDKPDEGKKIMSDISVFNKLDSSSYANKMLNAEVKYYETEPYKGMPAQVPMDVQKGWYVATKNTLGTTGNIKAFESNGRPSSFWICNVGYNGRIEFFSGMGDDACRQFNLDTGATLDTFPGLSTTETTTLVRKATQALTEAADKYKTGIRSVSIAGQQYNVGSPAIKNGGTQCQDFMDPNDCKILFNVCDPVICPSSRCDFGGKYPVTDVIQSGIVGSTLLCLPNWPEVKVPICISGIQAGIDSLTSVMRSYRDCLQESLNSGRTVGICDEINSIYMCEFFWKQASPLMNTLIPKAFEMAVTGGQGSKGGGEYLTVQGAWDNAKSSMDYFTQSYAVNSVKAFQVRETQDIGGEVCKGFVSLTTPNSLKNLIEPDSPPQFYARFDTTKYSDATVPATSQYKVYYQIYSGQDSGVYYNIYLKGAPTTSYYYSNPTLQVDSGFAAKGQSVSQTRDFTAPEGYKELCVRINDQERCGFSSVSTDFAVNNIKDLYAAEQITKKDITSEQHCISGTVVPTSLTGVVATGASLDSIGNGVYNYGVTRVCSTGNPGSTTDTTRFIDVGYCGDTKIRCWLDKRSVDASIGQENIGLRNQTLNDLNARAIKNLEASGEYLSQTQAQGELDKIKQAYNSLKSSFNANNAATLLYNIENLWKKLYMNNQKANLLLYKAQTQEEIAWNSAKGIIDQQKYVSETKVPKLTVGILKLNEAYDPDKEIAILAPDGGKIAYLKGGAVYSPTGLPIGGVLESSASVAGTGAVIDTVRIYRIKLDIELASGRVPVNYVKYLYLLNGAWIKDGQLLVDENSVAPATTTTPVTISERAEVYSFSLDKVYSPSAGEIQILDDYGKPAYNKGLLNKLGSIFKLTKSNYIGIYLSGEKIYLDGIGFEAGSLTPVMVDGNSGYSININGNFNAESPEDFETEKYLNALNGLVIVGNKIYTQDNVPKVAKNAGSCPANQYIVLKYSGLTNVADYFGFRCNPETSEIEVKMLIGTVKTVYQEYDKGTVPMREYVYTPFDWTAYPMEYVEYTDPDGGVTAEARSDVDIMVNAKDWADAKSLSQVLPSKQAVVSSESEEYLGFPGERTSPATPKPSPTSTEVQINQPLSLEAEYGSKERVFVKVGNALTNVYIEKNGVMRALTYQQYGSRDTAVGTVIGSVSGNILDKTITLKSNPNNIVDQKLYGLLSGTKILTQNRIGSMIPGGYMQPAIESSALYSGSYRSPFQEELGQPAQSSAQSTETKDSATNSNKLYLNEAYVPSRHIFLTSEKGIVYNLYALDGYMYYVDGDTYTKVGTISNENYVVLDIGTYVSSDNYSSIMQAVIKNIGQDNYNLLNNGFTITTIKQN